MADVQLIAQTPIDAQALAREAAAGLLQPQAVVSPKFLYDPLGSRLFDAITVLDEYYPTRTEAAIFSQHRQAIAQQVLAWTGAHPALVDLGAGDGAKAALWFDALQPRRYVALDISAQYLSQALTELAQAHPGMPMVGIGTDFADGFTLPAAVCDGPALSFYPGSSIGNFDDAQALQLLRDLRQAAQGGALLIGADLIKPAEVLEAAYDDALGVTAAFNLNLLRHLNSLMGADFNPRQWRHEARWVPQRAQVEMRLAAREALTVRWPGHTRAFQPGEDIHTESSRKWSPEGFAALLRDAGYRQVQRWTDDRGWFGVFLAQA